jgi:hypothetical protein
MRTKYEVADVLQQLGDGIEKLGLNTHILRHLNAIKKCRTIALGGHIDQCNNCNKTQISYNSCRNRHCPKCQGHKRHEWMQARTNELLPVPYFHVVFTMPHELNTLAMQHPAIIYDILFKAAWQTLNQFGCNIDLQMGMISILHTWGQNLSLHPHLHCIVPGGGVPTNVEAGNIIWKNCTAKGKYLFCVKSMSKVYRAKFVSLLRAQKIVPHAFTQTLFNKEWVVYAKRPFGNAQSVIEYLGRYTHKVAISNSRIINVDEQNINMHYKDYKKGGTKKVMQLSNAEFTRRFAQHILPAGFVRIRHFGILSSTWKRKRLPELQIALNIIATNAANKTPTLLKTCPCCKKGKLITISIFDNRGPPPLQLMGHKNLSC